jgi:hypothetical protein
MTKNFNADAVTAKTTANNEVLNEVFNRFQKQYHNLLKSANSIGVPCLKEVSEYSFATDIILNWCENPFSWTKKSKSTNDLETIDKCFGKLLDTYCQNNKQAYYELVVSCIATACVFKSWALDNESFNVESKALFAWRNKLLAKDTYTKYGITQQEIKDFETVCNHYPQP